MEAWELAYVNKRMSIPVAKEKHSGCSSITITQFGKTKEEAEDRYIALDNGQYCSMPNNRILWTEQSLTKVQGPPDFEACEEIYFSNTLRNYCHDEKWFYEGDEEQATQEGKKESQEENNAEEKAQ